MKIMEIFKAQYTGLYFSGRGVLMYTRALRKNIEEVRDQVVTHVRKNKSIYIAAGAGILAGAFGALLLKSQPVNVTQNVNVTVRGEKEES
jgi:hypothetical protein